MLPRVIWFLLELIVPFDFPKFDYFFQLILNLFTVNLFITFQLKAL